jgi:hypothetical protein
VPEQIHVNGEARIRTGTGAAAALEFLGVSVDGVDISIREHTEPVHTDTFGPSVPFDEQHFLQDAVISAQLVFYDEVVLAKIRNRMSGTDGVQGEAGALWGAGGKYFRLLILSPVEALPWNFPTARLMDAFEVKIGTRRSIWNLRFYAKPYTGVAGTSAGVPLYNRVTT